ncbi:MAG TPA: PhzF family phenazine biosynthesis protein [Crenotrichaceae bacterium]|nr:PhzF family phenazine biosynthesis protein [Crenotrichaceae bacterium]
MKYNYYVADVFTKQLFSGAQIAVFPKAEALSDNQMALIADELNLSETVFVLPPENDKATHKMRIFTPQGEIDFAGHPIIATAFVLAMCGELKMTEPTTSLMLEQNTGLIEAEVICRDGQPGFVQFTQTFSSTVDRFVPPNPELSSFLGISNTAIDNREYSVKLVSCDELPPYLIVPVVDYASVRKARFSTDIWSESSAPQTAAQEILLFAPHHQHHNSDFHLRLLGPNIAVNQDPPVGSTLPAFAAYLCSHEKIWPETHTFTLDRGDENSRYSLLSLEINPAHASLLTIHVGGDAVLVAEGTINSG